MYVFVTNGSLSFVYDSYKCQQTDHCARISYRNMACSVVCPRLTARQLASATYSRDGVICIWPRAI